MLPQPNAFLKFTEHSRHHHNAEAGTFPPSPKFLDSRYTYWWKLSEYVPQSDAGKPTLKLTLLKLTLQDWSCLDKPSSHNWSFLDKRIEEALRQG